MFIGNLATERTTEHEIARIFAQFGDIYEISLKKSFGFVQYDNPDSCFAAIKSENRRVIGGIEIGQSYFGFALSTSFNPAFSLDLSVASNRRGASNAVPKPKRLLPEVGPHYAESLWQQPTLGKPTLGKPTLGKPTPLSSVFGGRLLDLYINTSEFRLLRRFGEDIPEVQVVALGAVDT